MAAAVAEAFRGVGTSSGLHIWCTDNSRLLPVPKASHGKFYSASCYIVLSTVQLKSGTFLHDIHYWVGKDSKEADASFASEKAIDLDAVLGSCSVQYSEVQGCETEKFLSYFKPCIIPLKGAFFSSSENNQTYQVSLLRCEGEHAAHVTEVPFSRSSLSHNAVFILDTERKVFLFCGSNTSIQERSKALEVVRYIIDHRHDGRCEIANIEDGKFVNDRNSGEFWGLFGGYGPLTKDTPGTNKIQEILPLRDLYWINKGKLVQVEGTCLAKETLNSYKCFMLDIGSDIFVWMGRNTLVTERKMCIPAAEDFIHSQDRPKETRITFMTEGSETAQFKCCFDSWPQTVTPSLYNEGRKKVAAIFKYQGYDVKELPDDNLYQPSINCNGTLKAWLVDDGGVSLRPYSSHCQLYSGSCYILQYIYPFNGKNDNLFYVWIGRKSTEEDRIAAISKMATMTDSTKGHSVMARVLEGKEPIQFFSVCHVVLILMGGTSSSYKRSLIESGGIDVTYDTSKTSLFRVQGLDPNNMQAVQVDPVSSSLNSSYSYILQNADALYAWSGNLSRGHDHKILDKMLNLINPLKHPISVREGNEPDHFWNVIGPKLEYPKQRDIPRYSEDPHLFSCIFKEGNIKLKEIFNFCQEDLNSEGVAVLDCLDEIYVWVGQNSNAKLVEAFKVGEKFLEVDVIREGLSLESAIYVIAEGNEPQFFTRFFDWDFSKTCVQESSFERKLAALKGLSPKRMTTIHHSYGQKANTNPEREQNKYGSALFHSRSVTEASESTVTVNTTDKPTDVSLRDSSIEPVPEKESPRDIAKKVAMPTVQVEEQNGFKTFPYHLLKLPSPITSSEIDVTKREVFLSKMGIHMSARFTFIH